MPEEQTDAQSYSDSMARLQRVYRETLEQPPIDIPSQPTMTATEWIAPEQVRQRYGGNTVSFGTPTRSRQVEESHCIGCGTLLVKYKSKKVHRQSDGLHIQTMHKYECKSRLGWFGWFRILSDLCCPPQDINIVDYLDH